MGLFTLRAGRSGGARRVLEVERLETRDVPAALSLSVPGLSIDLSINDTKVTYSPQGLPASMAGNVYAGDSTTGQVVGHYQEALTPIIVNGQFVGTTGVATFTFCVPSMPGCTYETITTADTSYITGVDPTTGALLVSSTGTITASRGIFGDLQGGFASTSQVNLGPQFSGTTNVDFTISFA
jgi:hypothetical protein